MRVRRRVPHVVLALAALVAVIGCSGSDDAAGQPGIRVASFDFVENQLLGELYATAIERGGYPVFRLPGLGPREVVSPAMQQDLVDLVPEYTGSALRFLEDSGFRRESAQEPREALRSALTQRRLVALASAPGQDQNGVAVSRGTAQRLGLRAVSQLRAGAGELTFGGPPECAERPLCLRGLQDLYGLRFRSFIPFPSRAATAEALLAGQLDVGMLETVDAYLADGRLVLLHDDLGLQPAENVVPVLRQDVVQEHGPRLVAVIDALTATLTTSAMAELNRQVVLDGRALRDVAEAWLEKTAD